MVKTKVINKNKEREYPMLGVFEGSGKIILFVSRSEGTVVGFLNGHTPIDNINIGDYNKGWSDNWVPFEGSVTLEN